MEKYVSGCGLIILFFCSVIYVNVNQFVQSSLPFNQAHKKFISYHSKSSTNDLDASCLGMFDIGFQYKMRNKANSRSVYGEGYSSREWSQLLRGKEHATQSDEDYMPLTNSLAKTVFPFQGKLIMKNQSILQIMEGRIPYIPCPIRNYGEKELVQCLDARSKRNKKSWIIFMGDSRMRNEFHYLIYRTRNIMKWKIFKEKGKVTLFRFTIGLHEYLTWVNATSPTGDLLSYVGAVYGLKNKDPPHPKKFLNHLLQTSEKLPDIIIISFGSWHYAEMAVVKFGILLPHSEIVSTWNEMIKILEKLSQRMIIICLTLPRASPATRGGYSLNNQIQKESVQFVEFAMASFLKNKNVIFWDSTLPFNLASRKECIDLARYNRPLIEAELERDWVFQRFMCHDHVHKSGFTLHDETTMLLNLVCNKFMPKNENKYCCS